MTEDTWQLKANLLDAKGPQLIERVKMSEPFLTHLVSRQVITAIEKGDLKVSR